MTTILYVEDHPPAQMLMQAIIDELTDYRLMLAESGDTARTLARGVRPALYILDMDLPDTDGLTLAKTLAHIHPAPVILVSAYAEALQPGEYTYMAKPLDPDHVAETIRRTLAGRA